jgi:hypothetical protein
MKKSRTFLALFASLVLGSVAFAGQPQSAVSSEPDVAATPVAEKVVNPSKLPLSFKRSVLKMRFSLNGAGQPQDVQVLSNVDGEVKNQVVKAFKEWRFDVASVGHRLETTRFILPLDIIPEV